MIMWPSGFPQQLVGTSYQSDDPQMRTPLQSGRAVVRRRFSMVPVMYSAAWQMTSEQAEQFEEFYRLTLKDGSEWFYAPLYLPQGRNPQLVRFVGIYEGPTLISSPGSSCAVWQYSATLEIFARPSAY